MTIDYTAVTKMMNNLRNNGVECDGGDKNARGRYYSFGIPSTSKPQLWVSSYYGTETTVTITHFDNCLEEDEEDYYFNTTEEAESFIYNIIKR